MLKLITVSAKQVCQTDNTSKRQKLVETVILKKPLENNFYTALQIATKIPACFKLRCKGGKNCKNVKSNEAHLCSTEKRATGISVADYMLINRQHRKPR